MLNSRATAAQADPEVLHQAVAVIDMVLADLDAGRISADTAAKTIGLKVLTAREVVLEALRAPQNGGAAASEWRPIETAPNAGSNQRVWVLGGQYEKPTLVEADGSYWRYETRAWSGNSQIPTLWHPEIEPPALAKRLASQEPGTGGERS